MACRKQVPLATSLCSRLPGEAAGKLAGLWRQGSVPGGTVSPGGLRAPFPAAHQGHHILGSTCVPLGGIGFQILKVTAPAEALLLSP